MKGAREIMKVGECFVYICFRVERIIGVGLRRVEWGWVGEGLDGVGWSEGWLGVMWGCRMR